MTHEGETVLIPEEIHLNDILPQDIQSFYRFSGSLTTPYCNEVVTWTVFSNPTFMSSAQLQQFRTLTNSEGKPLVDNDRLVQPVGSRTIQFSGQGHWPSPSIGTDSDEIESNPSDSVGEWVVDNNDWIDNSSENSDQSADNESIVVDANPVDQSNVSFGQNH